ncbi:MAG: alpha/beta fold hydrolase [Verrucomicrobia bacterium]|nr:alpha/beta fold hydrolase [Verrucomicrobiota bacterium]
MRIPLKALGRHLALFLVYGVVAVLGTLFLGYVYFLHRQPPLKAWHTAALTQEFRAADAAQMPDFPAYLAREEALFEEVKKEVYDTVSEEDRRKFNRFFKGSLSDPTRVATNWNRSFVLTQPNPRGAVVLLHGLTDSPYSLRALGESLHQAGYFVLGVRMPGHGTAPVGLSRATLEDFTIVTRMAARYARDQVGPQTPLYLIGYSNGATLAVDYALARMEGEELPAVAGIILLSPAIGVTRGAALAAWQRRLASLPGLEKLTWQTLVPEFDPYKYNSFPVNGGEQIHRLTTRIEARLNRLDRGSGITNFPPVLAFQSVVDSTVLPRAVMDRFLRRLAPGNHELVLFDVRRDAEAKSLMVANPETFTEALMADRITPFGVTALTSDPQAPRSLRIIRRAAGQAEIESTPVPLRWPAGIFSLSHVALPFPPNDPVYGDGSGGSPEQIQLGHLEARGENGVLAISPSVLLRLRYNPFFEYVDQRVKAAVSGKR